jgi:catechol 2,3-dioxygenase-like lactoylglutathione lyase family enzyme
MNEMSPATEAGVTEALGPSRGDHEGYSPWDGWLSEAVLRVPDPDVAAGYYAELLGGTVEDAARVVLGSSTRLTLEEGSPGLSSATLEVAHHVDMGGVRADDDGYVRDPDGRMFKIKSTNEIEERLTDSQPRLSHLTFESPDPIRLQEFFEGFGFRVSEGLGQNFRWLRCNPIHHTIAFSRGDEPKAHHVGIELPDRNAIIGACDHVASLGHAVQYGPGRHLVGGNIFVYFLDRYGIRFELFCELERIQSRDREPLIREGVDRSRSVNVWGPQPSEAYWQGFV